MSVCCNCDLGGARHRKGCAFRENVLGCREAHEQMLKDIEALKAYAQKYLQELDRGRLAGLALRVRAAVPSHRL